MPPTSTRSVLLSAATSIALAACGPGTSSLQGPCAGDSPAAACGDACSASDPCPAGFFCTDGSCTAECTDGGRQCNADEVCGDDGRCVGPGDSVDAAPSLPDADCPDVMFIPMPVNPSIQLVIDYSGSMRSTFGTTGMTRFAAIRNALVGPTGVVRTFQDRVYFGASLYYDNGPTCPSLDSATGGRALNNLSAIETLVAVDPPGGNLTPTGPALEMANAELQANRPPADSPPYLILATDGEPGVCDSGDGDAKARVLAAATDAHNAGIPVFVLGVAVSATTRTHLQQVANVGQGLAATTSPGAPYFQADNPAQLSAALESIVGGVASCDLAVDRNINPAQAAQGIVIVNGVPLAYGTDWELVGDNVIRILGQACVNVRGMTDPQVQATFPCGAVVD
ncbi:MAG: VWA domain-containing protein [Kofleriaceae bacterium]|nr:VWA domain-containing protein [Kofleriaceae bacterium]MBP6837603.1 VWA domain-containing protein [Kofleriaceae bacterium]MBP9207757.1 VWA domain-containing protein [Kofleriaceae bacterium]